MELLPYSDNRRKKVKVRRDGGERLAGVVV